MLDTVERWQGVFTSVLGRRLVYAADEYYLLAGRPFPAAAAYDGFPQHENGIGMVRAFEAAYDGDDAAAHGRAPRLLRLGRRGAGRRATGPARTRRRPPVARPAGRRPPGRVDRAHRAPTGPRCWNRCWPLGRPDVRVLAVDNEFFGGNIGVAGLLTGADLARVLADQPDGHRYLLPDACLSEGRSSTA